MGNGLFRHYPNPTIASSWDPDWGSTYKKLPSCKGVTIGEPMNYNFESTLRAPYQCASDDPLDAPNSAVYRNMGNGLFRHYPNPTIASSWDPDWGSTYKKLPSCKGVTIGEPMSMNT